MTYTNQPKKKPYNPVDANPDNQRTLAHVFECVKKTIHLSLAPVVVFDLDSTLFDNRPRQVQIFREFAIQTANAQLYQTECSHFLDWDFIKALKRLGFSSEQAEQLYPELKQFWQARFFTSEYCKYDIAFSGAPDYVSLLHRTGAIIAYVTGRHEAMRQGTSECLGYYGFPLPHTHQQVHLLMKPELATPDHEFKKDIHTHVATLGRVCAAFDNEPAHANQLKASFPEASVVWIDSDHSTQPEPLRADLLKITGFCNYIQL